MGNALKTACMAAAVLSVISVIADAVLGGWKGGVLIHRVIGVLTVAVMIIGVRGEASEVISAVKNWGSTENTEDNGSALASNILSDAEKRIMEWKIPYIENEIREYILQTAPEGCAPTVRCVITPSGYNTAPMRIYITLRYDGPLDTGHIVKRAAEISMLEEEDVNITLTGT
ncbi:MAG: hypothetical protein E7315_00350 [Clostridiales bacterium]|nr:hypothetical protein [Clostridiales bacterium]